MNMMKATVMVKAKWEDGRRKGGREGGKEGGRGREEGGSDCHCQTVGRSVGRTPPLPLPLGFACMHWVEPRKLHTEMQLSVPPFLPKRLKSAEFNV